MERIGILHDEFTGAHYAEAWSNLISELGLYLVEIDGQLLVTSQFPSCDIGDDFLVRRAEAEIPLVTVLHAQEKRSVMVPAARFLPQFGGLDGGHQKLKGACSIHFLANDFLNLSNDPQTDRHPRE